MRALLAAFLLLTTCIYPLAAEIEEVIIRWRNQNCNDTCVSLLEREFRKLAGAADVVMDGKSGQATIRWKPRVRLRFSDINLAVRLVGASLIDIRVRARGTLTHAGKRITFDSLGDETQFSLLSPLQVEPNRMAVAANVDSYTITPETRQRLLDSEAGFYPVTITGPLLMPERSPPLFLIMEQIEGGAPDRPAPIPTKSSKYSNTGSKYAK